MGNLQEETDWECGSGGSNDEDSDDEEIKAGTERIQQQQQQAGRREVFPVLAPPEQFQNCLSPSATYEVRTLTPAPTQSIITQSQLGTAPLWDKHGNTRFLGLLLLYNLYNKAECPPYCHIILECIQTNPSVCAERGCCGAGGRGEPRLQRGQHGHRVHRLLLHRHREERQVLRQGPHPLHPG